MEKGHFIFTKLAKNLRVNQKLKLSVPVPRESSSSPATAYMCK